MSQSLRPKSYVGQLGSELVVRLIVIAVDGRLLDGAVHPLDLAIRPRVVGFCQTVLDGVGSADPVEAVDPSFARAGKNSERVRDRRLGGLVSLEAQLVEDLAASEAMRNVSNRRHDGLTLTASFGKRHRSAAERAWSGFPVFAAS